jgi:hypothetical protein
VIQVKILKGNDYVSVKEFYTPVAAFAFAVEEAINVLGVPKKGEEHHFHFNAGDGYISAWLYKTN